MGGMAEHGGGTASGMIACQNCGTSNRADATFCNTCGMLLPGATAPATGPTPTVASHPTPSHGTGRLPPQSRLAGHYVILKNVGQGGMAAVYRASDLRSGRVVAVKEMGQDGLSPEELKEALESFRFEAKTLTRLRHPNLPRVYEQFSEGARHYLVMEFIEGQTLEERLGAANGAGLSETEVLGWARQLCSVLSYLHSQRPPIIFRDLKPSNVMVTKSGAVKLIDFGIARVFAPGRTRDTQVLGTPGYAPPEQYGKAQTDARADVYALGCTLYQLLTGYDPATTPFALPPLHTRNPQVAVHVQLAIERATKLDRDARYGAVAAFEQDLLRPAGLYFRNGECARNRAELVALCLRQPSEGAEHLYSGRIEGWLRAWGDIDAADFATRAVRFNADHAAGLRAFVASPSSAPAPSSSSYTRPNWGSTGYSSSGYTSPSGSPSYASPRVGHRDASRRQRRGRRAADRRHAATLDLVWSPRRRAAWVAALYRQRAAGPAGRQRRGADHAARSLADGGQIAVRRGQHTGAGLGRDESHGGDWRAAGQLADQLRRPAHLPARHCRGAARWRSRDQRDLSSDSQRVSYGRLGESGEQSGHRGGSSVWSSVRGWNPLASGASTASSAASSARQATCPGDSQARGPPCQRTPSRRSTPWRRPGRRGWCDWRPPLCWR